MWSPKSNLVEKPIGFAGLVCLVARMRSQLVWAATGSLITLLITWIIPDQRVPPVVVAPAAGGELEASRGRVCMTNDELTVSLKFLCPAMQAVRVVGVLRSDACLQSLQLGSQLAVVPNCVCAEG